MLPGSLEETLLGEAVLGVEHDQLRARLLSLEVIGDQARPLVGTGRAAKRVGRRRDHYGSAICHCLELTTQQKGLLAGFPGMWHGRGRRLVVTGHRAPAKVDPRRQHQSVIAERRTAIQRNQPSLRVDRLRPILYYGHAFGADRVITEALNGDISEARDNRVAERASRVDRVFLDEGHYEPGLGAVQLAGAGGPGKATAKNDHAGLCLRHCRSRSRKQHGRGGGGTAAQECPPRRPHYRLSAGWAASQSAMAPISSSENPLAMRPMTVESREPLRKACIAAVISADWRPRIRGTGVSTSALTAWHPEQEEAPAGGSAAAAVSETTSGNTRPPALEALIRFSTKGAEPLTPD